MTLIDEHRKARGNRKIVVIHEFKMRYKKECNTIYGFVEGKDDIDFYTGFIEKYLPNDSWKVELWQVGGKKNVIEIYSNFNWNNYIKEQVIFFIDRDLSKFVNEKDIEDQNIYITDGYSIENSIVNSGSCINNVDVNSLL
jgi:hypothetical protein